MALYDPAKRQRDREWRRYVRVRARLKSADGWSDAAILNVSSRGLMIHSARCSTPGAEVELRGGDQVIRARVVWRKGQRAGLQSNAILPLMDIISLTESGPGDLALETARRAGKCTRSAATRPVEVDQWSRLLELGSVLAIASVVVMGFLSMGAGLVFDQLGAVASALRG